MTNLEKLAITRTRANAVYSIYKDIRSEEEALESLVWSELMDKLGMSPERAADTLTKVKKVIDDEANKKG